MQGVKKGKFVTLESHTLYQYNLFDLRQRQNPHRQLLCSVKGIVLEGRCVLFRRPGLNVPLSRWPQLPDGRAPTLTQSVTRSLLLLKGPCEQNSGTLMRERHQKLHQDRVMRTLGTARHVALSSLREERQATHPPSPPPTHILSMFLCTKDHSASTWKMSENKGSKTKSSKNTNS